MLGWPEIIIILAMFLLVIGPGKLPELMRSLGLAVKELKKATGEFEGEANASAQDATQIDTSRVVTRAQLARSVRARTINAVNDEAQASNGDLGEEESEEQQDDRLSSAELDTAS